MGSTEFVSILAALADMALRPRNAHQHLRKSRKVSQSFEKYHYRPRMPSGHVRARRIWKKCLIIWIRALTLCNSSAGKQHCRGGRWYLCHCNYGDFNGL